MVGLVETLRRERELTILMVTHQPEDIPSPSTRTLFVEDGRIAADGSFADLAARPTPALRRYLGGPR